MNKEDLNASAAELVRPSEKAMDEYMAREQSLVAEINRLMLDRPDIRDLVGENNLEMMKDNHANHARFVNSILCRPNPEALVDTTLWVFRAYRSRGFHPAYWAAQIATWVEVLRSQLSAEAFREIYPLYHWFSVNIPAFTGLTDPHPATATECRDRAPE